MATHRQIVELCRRGVMPMKTWAKPRHIKKYCKLYGEFACDKIDRHRSVEMGTSKKFNYEFIKKLTVPHYGRKAKLRREDGKIVEVAYGKYKQLRAEGRIISKQPEDA